MLAGEAIEFPGMPRANQHFAMERALTQRAAVVRTNSMHGVQFTVYITDSVGLTADTDFADFAGWKSGKFSDSEE